MVRGANDWPWSSCRATCWMVKPPEWLCTDWLLSTFAKTKKSAIERYREFVAQGKNEPSPWGQLQNQIYLGTEQFVEEMQCKMKLDQELSEIPNAQKRKSPKPLNYYEKKYQKSCNHNGLSQ